MTYREQAYVERCHCDEPAPTRCTMCNRPRCATHKMASGLCHRCDEAMGYEMAGGAPARQWFPGIAATLGAMGSILAHSLVAIFPVAGVAGGLTYATIRTVQRRRARRFLAPRLAATVGEVAPAKTYDSEVGNSPTYKAPFVP